jgi:hypothetical protein
MTYTRVVCVLVLMFAAGCGSSGAKNETADGGSGIGGNAGSGVLGGSAGQAGAGGGVAQVSMVSDAGGSPRLCPDIFDQTALSAYSFEISADNWAKLDADFHDLADVLAGNPPQTYYPIVFHYGSETVQNAAVRLRGKSSWVNTVMFDKNPKMAFDISFDQYDTHQKFHGVPTIHFEMARDEWSFLSERVGNNWFREIGLTAPCSNSATITINGQFYGLYVAEEGITKSLLGQFFPGNAGGDLLKGGTEAHTNVTTINWTKVQALDGAADMGTLRTLVDVPNTVLEWAAEAVVEDADGYYGGSHNFWIYDQGSAGYVWLLDHTDSALEWVEMFTKIGYREHPIYWWLGRPLPDPPAKNYLIVINDPTARSQYVNAIATQVAKWNAAEIVGWIDGWSQQIGDAVAQDTHKWATTDQYWTAIAAMKDMAQNRPQYLNGFLACENGDPAQATDQDGDGVAWCNDCDDSNASVHPGAPEVCGNHVDDNCNGVVDENCPGEAPGYPGQPDGGVPPSTAAGDGGTTNVDGGTAG